MLSAHVREGFIMDYMTIIYINSHIIHNKPFAYMSAQHLIEDICHALPVTRESPEKCGRNGVDRVCVDVHIHDRHHSFHISLENPGRAPMYNYLARRCL